MADVSEVEEYYRTLPDFQVEWIAWHEARQLEPEVIPILRSEVARRKLDPLLQDAIDIHERGLSRPELESLLSWFRGTPCPHCGKRGSPLNGCTIETLRGLIVMSVATREDVIGCPDCLESRLAAATDSIGALGCLTGGLLGWILAVGGGQRNRSELLKVRRGEITAAFLKHVKFDFAPIVLKWRASIGRGA